MDETSACIDGYQKVPLPSDHIKINKFSGPDDPAYNAIYPLIMDMAQKAVRIVEGRLSRKQISMHLDTQADISTAQNIIEDDSSMVNSRNIKQSH